MPALQKVYPKFRVACISESPNVPVIIFFIQAKDITKLRECNDGVVKTLR